MNNFSDITAIDTADQLTAHLRIKAHGQPTCEVSLNDTKFDLTAGENQFDVKLDLLEPIILTVNILEPNDGVVELTELSINGVEVLPLYQHLASISTVWLNQPGIWYYRIPGPFYPWYHDITGLGFIA